MFGLFKRSATTKNGKRKNYVRLNVEVLGDRDLPSANIGLSVMGDVPAG